MKKDSLQLHKENGITDESSRDLDFTDSRRITEKLVYVPNETNNLAYQAKIRKYRRKKFNLSQTMEYAL